MDTRLPAKSQSDMSHSDEMIMHSLDDFGSPHMMDTGEPQMRHLSGAQQSARGCAGRHTGRPHPDQGPLTGATPRPGHDHPDQDAPRFPIPEMIRNVICVLGFLAIVFGMLMMLGVSQ